MIKLVLLGLISILCFSNFIRSTKNYDCIQNSLHVDGIEVNICDSFHITMIDDSNRHFNPKIRGNYIDTNGLSEGFKYCEVRFSFKNYCIVDTIPQMGTISNDRIIWKWYIDSKRKACYVNVLFPDIGTIIVSESNGCCDNQLNAVELSRVFAQNPFVSAGKAVKLYNAKFY